MNHFRHPPDLDPFAGALDAIMADIAISVQLPPGLHAKAGGRYEAIRDFAERPGSPLNGRILRFYPQGSMAIDATTSTRGTDDEYDLDIVAALDLDPHSDPDAVLDLLYRSLEGYPTGQKVERQTRCVTVRYADRMHVDVTPAVRLGHGAERVSHIFHAHPDKPAWEHFHVPMNAYGFAEWYRARTPLERRFAAAFNKRLHEAYGMEVRADAEVDDILDQVPIIVKAVATVALQLLKRHRNVAYAGSTGRIPPSVMLSCFAGQASQPGLPLTDMVIRLARTVASALRAASARRERIRVANPVHPEDCFTDRWPENLAQQDAYAAKLTDLADGLAWIKQHGSSLEDIQEWLRERFGGHVVSTSVRRFNDRTGRAVQSGLHAYTPRGGLYVPSRPALVGVGGAAAAAPARASAHTFRGGAPVVSVFPSIADQDRAIRASWPSFRLVERSERAATWLGTLKPFMLAYEVRVSYRVPLVVERIAPLRQQPEVRVISPALRRRPGDGEGPLPHVYVDRAGDPVLCLFDHETGEWTPFRLIAETTIPWALDWLGCYEGWRATGRWSGGGRHAEPPAAKEAGR